MLVGNETIYQIFVRNYSNEGTFKAVEKDLNRIRDLGVDIVYLMPINEIGLKNRKGKYGSPYASKDYFSISSDLGNLDDLKSLIDTCHKLGMKIILDMVFNHTAPDSKLFLEHPEFYYRKNDGKVGNRVGDWSDIIDLDTHKEETQDYLLGVLQYWISTGFDGFRFDVASMIDFNFFIKARKKMGKDVIFLSESIDDDFAQYVKQLGIYSTPDEEMFPIFDCLYNYSWYRPLEKYLKGESDLSNLLDAINKDYKVMPKNYLRCNCIENHDNERIASLVKDEEKLIEFTRLSYYLKGCAFIYAGQEYGLKHKSDLFEKDAIDWSEKNEDIFKLHKKLIKEKHDSKVVDYNICKICNNKIVVERILNNNVIQSEEFVLI